MPSWLLRSYHPGLVSLWVIFPFVYCPHCAAPLCCSRKASLWYGGQMRGDVVYFRGGWYNSWSLGSPGLWDWQGAWRTIEPTDGSSVMAGRSARLQQGTKLHFNSTSVDLWHVVLLTMIIQYDVSVNLIGKLSLEFRGQASCSQALQQGNSCWSGGFAVKDTENSKLWIC